MTEAFLHYVWQFQYFKKDDLETSDKNPLQIFQPGMRNTNAGPDFEEAKIKIGKLEWRGSVEIHIKASGWNDHHHSDDQAYEKVVLHVVWENDKPIKRTDGTFMPTLELKNRVDPALYNQYKNLFTNTDSIPCGSRWREIPEIVKFSMLDKAVVLRLEKKAEIIKGLLKKNHNNWDETCFQLLCKNFGFNVNAEPMLQLAKALPYKVLLKHLDKPIQIEALLFGQAGFLEKLKTDDYCEVLIREYNLLRKKYSLDGRQMNLVQWRFLRLRPSNFPTVRLAQLASLLGRQQNLFSKVLEASSSKDLVNLFDVSQSEYWQQHYLLGKKSKTRVPDLGKSSMQNIIINTIAPLLVVYGQVYDDQSYLERAVDILQNIPSENNKITREWAALGYKVTSAFDSQGFIELYNSFCLKRRCLECMVGSSIIKVA